MKWDCKWHENDRLRDTSNHCVRIQQNCHLTRHNTYVTSTVCKGMNVTVFPGLAEFFPHLSYSGGDDCHLKQLCPSPDIEVF